MSSGTDRSHHTDARATREVPSRESRGRLAVRRAWPLVALLSVAIAALGVPAMFAQAQQHCATSACLGWQSTAASAAALQQAGIPLAAWAGLTTGLAVFAVLADVALAAIVYWRARGEATALLLAYLLVLIGPDNLFVALSAARSPLALPAALLDATGLFLLFWLFYIFPDGRFVPAWAPGLLATQAVIQGYETFVQPGTEVLNTLAGLANLASLAILAGAQVYRFRRVSAWVARQQTKWVVFSLATVVGARILVGLPTLFVPALAGPQSIYGPITDMLFTLVTGLIPLSFALAVLRYRLWDIDVLIRRTLIYAALTASLLGVYFGGVALLAAALQPLTGGGNDLAIVATTLFIAALFNPLRRRIQALHRPALLSPQVRRRPDRRRLRRPPAR